MLHSDIFLGLLSGSLLAMDNIAFGICYAVIFSNLYGNMIFGGVKNKKVWETFVFVNPKYHGGEENHDATE